MTNLVEFIERKIIKGILEKGERKKWQKIGMIIPSNVMHVNKNSLLTRVWFVQD